MLQRPVLWSDLMMSFPRLPIPQQARFTLSLGATYPNVLPNTAEGRIENPAIAVVAIALVLKNSLLLIFLYFLFVVSFFTTIGT
jgi:hypothetical protein